MGDYTKRASGFSKAEEDKILKEARRRMRYAMEADAKDRARAMAERRFVWNADNCQWDDDAKQRRKDRPMLTENRNPAFVRQATNEVRRSRPQIRALPVDGQGDVYTAQIIEGLIRNIEANSRADMAYDQAVESAAYCGRGYWRITTKYQGDGFDQDIVEEPIADAFSIVDDPDCVYPDKSDRKFAFEVEKFDREEFETEYGFKPTTFTEAVDALGDDAKYWQDEKNVYVANYWRVVEEKKRIYMLDDGQVVEHLPEGVKARQERDLVTRRVEWFCISGTRAISKGEWAGEFIPLVFVGCEQMKIDGQHHTKGMTFDAHDLTKANNYLLSAQIENIALTPKIPFVGPKGAFDSDRPKWNAINSETHPFVEYDVTDIDGKPLPPPQRSIGATAQPEISQVRMGVIDGQRSVIGLMGASLGDGGPEVAYKAIEARQTRGDTAVFHVMDNTVRAVRYAGMVIVDLMGKVYDAARVVRIINPDGEPAMQAINQAFVDQRTGQLRSISFRAGKYDITVSAGPAFETQRQRDNAMLVDLAAKVPALSVAAPDLMVKQLLPGTDGDKMAQRVAKTLDPNLTGEGPTPREQQMQQQMQQMQGALQQAQNQAAFLESEMAKQQEALAREKEKTELQRVTGEQKIEAGRLELEKKNVELMRAQAKPLAEAAGMTFGPNGEPVPAPEPEFEEPKPEAAEILAPALDALGQAIAQGQQLLAQALAQSNAQIAQGLQMMAASTERAAMMRRRVRMPDGRELSSEAIQ